MLRIKERRDDTNQLKKKKEVPIDLGLQKLYDILMEDDDLPENLAMDIQVTYA